MDDDFEGESYDEEDEEIIDHEAKIQEVYEKYKAKDPGIQEADQENSISMNQSVEADPNRTPAKARFQPLAADTGNKQEEQKVPDTPGQDSEGY